MAACMSSAVSMCAWRESTDVTVHSLIAMSQWIQESRAGKRQKDKKENNSSVKHYCELC